MFNAIWDFLLLEGAVESAELQHFGARVGQPRKEVGHAQFEVQMTVILVGAVVAHAARRLQLHVERVELGQLGVGQLAHALAVPPRRRHKHLSAFGVEPHIPQRRLQPERVGRRQRRQLGVGGRLPAAEAKVERHAGAARHARRLDAALCCQAIDRRVGIVGVVEAKPCVSSLAPQLLISIKKLVYDKKN